MGNENNNVGKSIMLPVHFFSCYCHCKCYSSKYKDQNNIDQNDIDQITCKRNGSDMLRSKMPQHPWSLLGILFLNLQFYYI